MIRGNISPGKPEVARLILLLNADKLHFRNISQCQKLGLCSKIRPIECLGTIFSPLFFSLSAIFCF